MVNETSISSRDVYSLESVVDRINQGLDFTNGDPLIADFALIHSPVKFVSMIVAIVAVIKTVQAWMSTRSTAISFARPAFLVNCGLCFGINGCGLFIALAVTDGGSHLFKTIQLQDLSLYTIFCRYLVFTYLATLIYDLASLTFVILQKQTVSNVLILRQLVWIAIAYTIMKHQPIGFTILVPLVHCLLKAMNNMLTVMETASKELKPEIKWTNRVQMVSIAVHFGLICHLAYFATHPSTCPPLVVSTLLALVTVQTLTVLSLAVPSSSSGKVKHVDSPAHFTKLILG